MRTTADYDAMAAHLAASGNVQRPRHGSEDDEEVLVDC